MFKIQMTMEAKPLAFSVYKLTCLSLYFNDDIIFISEFE